jgi:hypothetical protein
MVLREFGEYTLKFLIKLPILLYYTNLKSHLCTYVNTAKLNNTIS